MLQSNALKKMEISKRWFGSKLNFAKIEKKNAKIYRISDQSKSKDIINGTSGLIKSKILQRFDISTMSSYMYNSIHTSPVNLPNLSKSGLCSKIKINGKCKRFFKE